MCGCLSVSLIKYDLPLDIGGVEDLMDAIDAIDEIDDDAMSDDSVAVVVVVVDIGQDDGRDAVHSDRGALGVIRDQIYSYPYQSPKTVKSL